MVLHAKIVRIDQISAIYPVLVVKIACRIVIFRKILDGDPTKITKMSRNFDLLEVIAEIT